MKLESYVEGRWVTGQGEGRPFHNPVTEEVLGTVDDTGIDAAAALEFARAKGTPALQALSFAERAEILRSVADVLAAHRDYYFEIARLNSGNTATDAAIDIDGGIATLKVYARLGKTLGAARVLVEPGQDQLAKDPIFFSRHLWTSRPGAALQINAFNFPSWGLWEKVAAALLAGVASVTKPASATAWLSHQMVHDVVEAGVVPEGALSLVCGAGASLVDALRPMDSLAFTGSADTGLALRSVESVLCHAPRVTIEADSVNASILGPDAAPGSPLFDLARREAVKALSVKAGQLCTNIRRILVPETQMVAFVEAVAADLDGIPVGDPADPSVRTGPLVNAIQRAAALAGIDRLKAEAQVVRGGSIPPQVVGVAPGRGAFLALTLLACDDPASASAVHETEVFGPCVTVMPYRSLDEAAALAARGGGSLALSLFSGDPQAQRAIVEGLAPWHGRILIVDEEVGRSHTGHAIVMPHCVHGGPGRAGGGEELGGLRGLRLHMQRSALQGGSALHSRLTADGAEASL